MLSPVCEPDPESADTWGNAWFVTTEKELDQAVFMIAPANPPQLCCLWWKGLEKDDRTV